MTTALATADWRDLRAALLAFFGPRVANPEQRADLVQQVLLRMHERRDQLRDAERVEAWAFRIARHALIDHYRARGRHIHAPLPAQELADSSSSALAAEADQGDSARVLGAWVRVQIQRLPAPYREALTATELRGESQREAACRLGVPASTFKSRVQRGRDLLHAELLSCCAVELDGRGRVIDYAPRPERSCDDCDPCG